MIINAKSYPRIGLAGNPSDGYFGKTISFAFKNFFAEILLYQTPKLEILPSAKDHSCFESMNRLSKDVSLFGYYGGIRLLKATIKQFHDYCKSNKIKLDDRNFTIEYQCTIPHRVGLAGSSAIITACLRALMIFYQIDIPKPIQANLILSVEKDELNIPAGLQDRVIQVYEGLVYMDFDKNQMNNKGYGIYKEMNPGLLPPLYVAYRTDLSEGSEVFHNNIRERFENGDKEVISAIKFWAELTDKVRDCLLTENKNSKIRKLSKFINANFDMRKNIYKISSENIEMVEIARSTGASSKFTGSGGAIVGTYENEKMYQKLKEKFSKYNISILKPLITSKGKSI